MPNLGKLLTSKLVIKFTQPAGYMSSWLNHVLLEAYNSFALDWLKT